MKLLISNKGLKVVPESLSKEAVNNGYDLHNDGHGLIVCDFTLYKLKLLDNFIINELITGEDTDFNFCKLYPNKDIKDYCYDNYEPNYFKLLKNSHLDLNNKAYCFNGYLRFDSTKYNFYKYFDTTDLINYLEHPYFCDKALAPYVSNTLKLIHKDAKDLSLAYVFKLNNPTKIINLQHLK